MVKVNEDQRRLYQTQVASLERQLLETESSKESQLSQLRNQVDLHSRRDVVRENVEMLRLQKDAKDKEVEQREYE